MKAATSFTVEPRKQYIISIHAAREGGDRKTKLHNVRQLISIHAAREGGDRVKLAAAIFLYISIHAAREGGDYR